MRRTVQLLVVLILVLGACGSATTEVSGSASQPVAATPTPEATAAGSVTPDPTADLAPATSDGSAPSGVEGPVAPDFSLVLADGSTFTLSEGTKPVYMVFWAEW